VNNELEWIWKEGGMASFIQSLNAYVMISKKKRKKKKWRRKEEQRRLIIESEVIGREGERKEM
jgi:hypothetical protein